MELVHLCLLSLVLFLSVLLLLSELFLLCLLISFPLDSIFLSLGGILRLLCVCFVLGLNFDLVILFSVCFFFLCFVGVFGHLGRALLVVVCFLQILVGVITKFFLLL